MSKKTKAICLENFSSTATLANNEVIVPVGSQDTLNEKDYDPYEHRNVLHPNTYFGALVHLLKCSLGTGILAIPRAFKASGLAVGVVGTVFIGILCTYTIHILMVASLKMCKLTKKPGLDFSETIFEIVKHGPKGCRKYARSAKIFVESGLLLSYYVGGSVYIVFISTSIKQLMDYLYPELIEYSDRWYMVIIMVLLIIFCQVRELKHMVPFSFTANAMMVIAFGITLYYIFLRIDNVDFKEIKMVGNLTGMPVFFSTVMFAMEGKTIKKIFKKYYIYFLGIGSIFPLENTMIKPQFLGCFGVLNVTMTLITIMYLCMGFFGYLAFGEVTEATITKNLPVEEVVAQVAKWCISLAVFFTFMLMFYVPIDITWRKISGHISEKRHNLSQFSLRTGIVIFATCIAIFAGEHLGPLIELVGAIFLSTLGLMVPAIMDTLINWDNLGCFYWKFWKNLVISIFGLFGAVAGSYYAILSMVNEES
ncbi:unnamed protein product [Brassicogethes aeneus]|uniref:Amino acid transporter transmembrane domain-containing protein n=1 Tax=Brassicogethes aeneus TaxID=1431903 RepID=A0A9P0FM36_BRAAE|nr:unnamed protein product [Brassicogethes aeneus]